MSIKPIGWDYFEFGPLIDMGDYDSEKVLSIVSAPLFYALDYLELRDIRIRVFSVDRHAKKITLEWTNVDT